MTRLTDRHKTIPYFKRVLVSSDTWGRSKGVKIERFNLAQQPMDFAQNSTIKAFLETAGAEALPVTLVDGQLALAGRHPSRADLARWGGITETNTPPAQGGCCSGSRCC
ncbi:arsenic metallochaperone ArsD family protein [Ralstonia mannitolilytica]|uniref:arsenic metallochaperone ArsD family protein n=1 Tax=Ralstonia mannitolilytica TaxID=105219 RepID=UPI000C7B161D|nr:arsenical resistance operon transcriptional repressor ArsD [Ralstonia mannitolilytica]